MNDVYSQVARFKTKYPGGIAWRVKAHSKIVEDYLNNDEEVTYAFCAQKNEKFSELFNTYAIAITNKRLILGHKRLIWGSFMSTITPDLYNDMQIYKGLIWGRVVIDTVKEVVVLTNLPKKSLDEIGNVISEFMMEQKKLYKKNEEEK